jgi:hypothetical protein
MDVFLGGEGFSFKISGSTAHEDDRQHFVRPDKVSIHVKNLNIKLKRSRHKLLFTLFKPLMYRAVRPVTEKALEKQIRQSFVKVDKLAYDIYTEARRAQELARQESGEKESIYSYYLDAVRKQLVERREKATGKQKPVTKVNVAITEADALLKDVKLPEGISTKATEFKNLAAQGDKWESPVFTIGSAPPSMDLPKLPPITRKRHGTAAEASELRVSDQAEESTH